jgi:hypothetical protein
MFTIPAEHCGYQALDALTYHASFSGSRIGGKTFVISRRAASEQ